MNHYRRTFLTLYLSIFISSLGIGILAPILPAYIDQYSASALILGVIFGSFSAARTLLMPPIGKLSDRYGRRGFILAGLALFSLVSPMYALARSPLQLILVRFVHGIAGAMLMPVAMSAVGDIAPPGREGFVMGTFTSAFFAGMGFGPLLGGFVRDRYSMEASFVSMGILSLLALVFTLLALPPGAIPATGKLRKGGALSTVSRQSLMTDKPLLGLLFFRFSRAVGIGLVWVIMPLFAVKSLGLSAFSVGILLSANTFITTILQSPAGHMSDRLGHRNTLTVGSALACAGIATMAWAQTFFHLLYASAVLGIAGALIVPAGSALAVTLGRGRGMGRTMGLYNSSLSLGTMLGPVFGGALLDLGGVGSVFLTGAAFGFLGWLALILTIPSDNPGK